MLLYFVATRRGKEKEGIHIRIYNMLSGPVVVVVISESVGLFRSERDTGRTRANNNNRPTAYLYAYYTYFFFVDVLPEGNVSYNMIIRTPTGCIHTLAIHTLRFCVRAQAGRRGKSVQVKISTSHLCKYRWPEREANKFSHRLCAHTHAV